MEYQDSSKMVDLAKFLLIYSVVITLLILPVDPAVAKKVDSVDFVQLDRRTRTVLHEIYRYHSKTNKSTLTNFKSISELETAVKKYADRKDFLSSVSTILHNIDLIKANLDNRSILFFISLLLENNEWRIASELFDNIKRDGEKSLVSNVSYIFARQHFNNNEWQDCLKYTTDIYADLPENDANYARIITGVSLQNLKQHRKAIEIYEKVPEISPSYLYARLNIAVAYIRQGWWTDARNVINDVLKIENSIINHDDMIDRLYLVLGYSLLQKEYYRDSREAFRNISKNSQYEHRALLGIGLSSANQGDYIGALNVLSLLKSKTKMDLSVDESYLLFPFVYKKLNQQLTASTSYNEAIEYYQKRIDELDKLAKTKIPALNSIHYSESNQLEIGNNIFDYDKSYPVQFLRNRAKIKQLDKTVAGWNNNNAKALLNRFNDLKRTYDDAFIHILNQHITQRKDYLSSYLNQSRYGLASLYDNNISANN